MIIRFYYREFSIRERCPQVDIIRLDRTARLEMTMKRHEFVALIFSDVAIYLIAAYSPEDYFSGKLGSAYSSRAFRQLFRTYSEKF